MTFKNFICKGVLVFTGLLLIGWLGQYIYMVNGEIDWFRFMLVYGVPVGIPHMFIIVPWQWDLSGILGMVALCVAFVIVHNARKNSFQHVRNVQIATTTIPGFSIGITILVYN